MRSETKFILAVSLVLSALPLASAQTIEQTFAATIENNPEIESARIEIEILNERLAAARTGRSVQVSAGISAMIQSIASNRPFGADTGETLVGQAQIEASLPVFTGGEVGANIEQARFAAKAAENKLNAVIQDTLLSSANAHMAVIQAQKAVLIRNQNVDRLQEQRRAAEDRFDAGVITKTDVAQAEARLKASEAGLAAAEADFAAARAQYEQFSGVAPESPAAPSGDPVLPVDLSEALMILETNSPALLQIDALEKLADAGIQAAMSKKKPRVELFGTASTRDGSWDNQFRDDSAVIGARGTIPLYTGGLLDAGIREAKLSRSQIRMNRQSVRNQLVSALSQAWASHLSAQTGLDAAREEVNASKIALDGAEVELDVGLRTTLELLDQEQDLLEAQLRLIQAEKNVYVSASNILSLLGQIAQ